MLIEAGLDERIRATAAFQMNLEVVIVEVTIELFDFMGKFEVEDSVATFIAVRPIPIDTFDTL